MVPHASALRRVRDLVVRIWGAGRITTAAKFAAMDCTVLIDDHGTRATPFEAVPVAGLLARSDVVCLHVPLGSARQGLVGAAELTLMRAGSLLVNTARGAVVDTDALALALDAGRPGAAVLEVLLDESRLPTDLAGRTGVVLAPHVAFSSVQSVLELRLRAADEVVRVLRGDPTLHPYGASSG